MKNILIIALIACFCPESAWGFNGSSINYRLDYAIDGIDLAEGSSVDYTLIANLLYQPVGQFESPHYRLCLGPYCIASPAPGDDSDKDGIANSSDNCPNTYNPSQKDTYPPGGNNIGDGCECEGDFDCDGDVDSFDITAFLTDFGRGEYVSPCENSNPCYGDFSCDGDVDSFDITLFLEDFGRGEYVNPCPACEVQDWCSY